MDYWVLEVEGGVKWEVKGGVTRFALEVTRFALDECLAAGTTIVHL